MRGGSPPPVLPNQYRTRPGTGINLAIVEANPDLKNILAPVLENQLAADSVQVSSVNAATSAGAVTLLRHITSRYVHAPEAFRAFRGNDDEDETEVWDDDTLRSDGASTIRSLSTQSAPEEGTTSAADEDGQEPVESEDDSILRSGSSSDSIHRFGSIGSRLDRQGLPRSLAQGRGRDADETRFDDRSDRIAADRDDEDTNDQSDASQNSSSTYRRSCSQNLGAPDETRPERPGQPVTMQ